MVAIVSVWRENTILTHLPLEGIDQVTDLQHNSLALVSLLTSKNFKVLAVKAALLSVGACMVVALSLVGILSCPFSLPILG